MPDAVLISGLGLMGGSLAAALSATDRRVYLHHRRPEVVADAVARGWGEALPEKDLLPQDLAVVVLGVPVQAVPSLACEWLARGAPLVTDMGSSKAMICQQLAGRAFLGSHPMCGSHRQGLQHADPNLFRGARCVLTPSPGSPEAALPLLRELWTSVGCTILEMAPETHDALVAEASHLPHLLSCLSARLLSPAALPLAASGFADTSRVAAGSPGLWREILLSNIDAVRSGLAQAQADLQALDTHLKAADAPALEAWLDQARERREEFDRARNSN